MGEDVEFSQADVPADTGFDLTPERAGAMVHALDERVQALPAHADKTASLKVDVGDDGRLLVHCHAGCSAEAVVGAMGLSVPDLYPDGERLVQKNVVVGRRQQLAAKEDMPPQPIEPALVEEMHRALTRAGRDYLIRFLLGKTGRRWDGVPVPGVAIKDLDATILTRFRERAARSKRLGADALDEDDSGLIEKLRLTEGRYLKRAAILLFHPDPERFFTGAAVKFGYFESDADLRYHDEVHGDLFTQVSKAMDLLLTKYLKAGISYEGIQRVLAACREAGTPEPRIQVEPGELWVEFPFSAAYLASTSTVDRPPEASGKTTQERVLSLLREDPGLTRRALADRIGITPDGIKYHLDRLRDAGRIRHVGPTKKGRWVVLEGSHE